MADKVVNWTNILPDGTLGAYMADHTHMLLYLWRQTDNSLLSFRGNINKFYHISGSDI